MSFNSIGGVNPQATVEEQFKILSQIDNGEVKALISSTLSDWQGREVSSGDISSAIEKVSLLVQEKMGSVNREQEGEIHNALASLKAAGEQIQRIGSAASSSLGIEARKTVETILSEIDGDHLEDHPAYRSGWNYPIAREAMSLHSVPVGSYVIIGTKDSLHFMIKEEGGELN